MKYKKEDVKHAENTLREILKPGDVVQTILRNVSRSGMSRNIDVYHFDKNGGKFYLSWCVAIILGYPQTKDGSVKIGGCGMDMGFALVHSLSYALFGAGYDCIGEDCPAADHVNTPRVPRKAGSVRHKDGYALKQEWI